MRTVLALSLVFVACGPGGRDERDGDGDGSGSGSGSGNQDNCSDAAKLIYTIDASNTLSKFDPSTKTFTDIGELDCPTTALLAGPFSMGVDRDAVAWILFSNGLGGVDGLYRVDTTTLACTKASWATQQGLVVFGMGFSSNVAGSTDDTLFVAGGTDNMAPTSKLATVSISSFQATPVGSVTGWPELTGTGNAELWGWFPDESAPRVEQINKTTGAALKTYPLAALAGKPSSWAFAFWGGDFWVFLGLDDMDLPLPTKIYQVDGTTGQIESTTDTAATKARNIVGAGVSTCAPVVIL
jgi:hypothetical protein